MYGYGLLGSPYQGGLLGRQVSYGTPWGLGAYGMGYGGGYEQPAMEFANYSIEPTNGGERSFTGEQLSMPQDILNYMSWLGTPGKTDKRHGMFLDDIYRRGE